MVTATFYQFSQNRLIHIASLAQQTALHFHCLNICKASADRTSPRDTRYFHTTMHGLRFCRLVCLPGHWFWIMSSPNCLFTLCFWELMNAILGCVKETSHLWYYRWKSDIYASVTHWRDCVIYTLRKLCCTINCLKKVFLATGSELHSAELLSPKVCFGRNWWSFPSLHPPSTTTITLFLSLCAYSGLHPTQTKPISHWCSWWVHCPTVPPQECCAFEYVH